MAKSIPGGAYQNPDGSWHDANGKPLSPRAGEQLKQLQAEQAEEREAAEANLEEQAAVSTETPPEQATTKKRKTKGGD